MEIPKAVEILTLNIKDAGRTMPPDVKDALTTAIAAMLLVEQYEKVDNGENKN